MLTEPFDCCCCCQGYKILTGSWVGHNALQIWGYTEGKLEKNVPFPSDSTGEFLYCAQFCDNNVVLAGGSGTNSVQAVNTETGEVSLGEMDVSQ